MNNPTMLYRYPGRMVELECGKFDFVIVDEAEIEAHIKCGWSLTFADLPHKINENAPPTRAELEEKAKQLGLRFDGRTSDAKLAANIEAVLNGVDKT